MLAARDVIREPFAVINADDYYGKEAFSLLHGFLCQPHEDNEFCMAGFILKNTLSDNGGVTRGVCHADENGFLTDVVETPNIVKTVKDGVIGAEADGQVMDVNVPVSMNMWGLSPAFMKTLAAGFEAFLDAKAKENPLKAEFLIPIFIGQLLEEGRVSVKVLRTRDAWFGVTYKEDKEFVVQSFKKLIEDGVYQPDLFSDI